MVLCPCRWNAGVQEPRCGAERGRAAGLGICLWFPELQDWGPRSPGLSKAGLLRGQSETPTGQSAETATRCLGPHFQGPVSPVRHGQGCGCLPMRGHPGVHWDASRRHRSAQFWWKRGRARSEHRSAERQSGAAGAAGGFGGQEPTQGQRPSPPTRPPASGCPQSEDRWVRPSSSQNSQDRMGL